MPIAINGAGTITGISAGGLPDSCITTDDIAANAVTAAKLGADQASGLAKAWVNFNGTGTVAIRASFNVSSITDNASADYTVNFTTALSDANYSLGGMAEDHSNAEGYAVVGLPNAGTKTTTACRVRTWRLNVGNVDCPTVCVVVFR